MMVVEVAHVLVVVVVVVAAAATATKTGRHNLNCLICEITRCSTHTHSSSSSSSSSSSILADVADSWSSRYDTDCVEPSSYLLSVTYRPQSFYMRPIGYRQL